MEAAEWRNLVRQPHELCLVLRLTAIDCVRQQKKKKNTKMQNSKKPLIHLTLPPFDWNLLTVPLMKGKLLLRLAVLHASRSTFPQHPFFVWIYIFFLLHYAQGNRWNSLEVILSEMSSCVITRGKKRSAIMGSACSFACNLAPHLSLQSTGRPQKTRWSRTCPCPHTSFSLLRRRGLEGRGRRLSALVAPR